MHKSLIITRQIIFLFLIVSWFIFSFPNSAFAQAYINPQLEQQVLKIIREHPEVILESVQKYQQQIQQQQIAQQRKPFFEAIKNNPQGVIGYSPYLGATEKKVLLVEFSDFQCPYCARAAQTVKEFMAKHSDEVTLVYKHLPLSAIHPQAMAAAQAAYAAQQQGKFWQYHDALFAQQKQLGEVLYSQIAQSLDLDLEQFNQDRKESITSIQKDLQLAQQLQINGTPFFVLGNQAFSGAVPLSEMEAILEKIETN